MELVHCKAQCSCEEECIPKCMLYIVVFFEKVELIKLEDWEGGGPLSQHSSVYRCTTMYMQSIHIFVMIYVYIISLVVICFKQIWEHIWEKGPIGI